MAVHQAADTFELITGRPADRDAMFRDFDEMVAVEDSKTEHLARSRSGNLRRKEAVMPAPRNRRGIALAACALAPLMVLAACGG